jgi:hypothetical protein
MKTVVSNSMVAHLWAHQSQDTARSGNGNIWFEGTTLYSYRTPIANFVVSPKGKHVALISSQGYSPTTGGHLRDASRALGSYDLGRTVTFMNVTPRRNWLITTKQSHRHGAREIPFLNGIVITLTPD